MASEESRVQNKRTVEVRGRKLRLRDVGARPRQVEGLRVLQRGGLADERVGQQRKALAVGQGVGQAPPTSVAQADGCPGQRFALRTQQSDQDQLFRDLDGEDG